VITELTATGSGLPASALVLGPVPVPVRGKGDAHSAPAGISGEGPDGGAADPAEPRVRAFVRVDPPDRKALAGALRVLAASRSLRKDLHPLRVEIDPVDLG
jgi:hypothetical protein